MRPDPYPIKAFTLIELLVAISIIVLLVALLLPGLNQARYQAQVVKCKSLFRSLGIGLTIYTDDNKGHYPTPTAAPANWKQSEKAAFLGFSPDPLDLYDIRKAYRDVLGSTLKRAMLCPLAPDELRTSDIDAGWAARGNTSFMLYRSTNDANASFPFAVGTATARRDEYWSPSTAPTAKFSILASTMAGGPNFFAPYTYSGHPLAGGQGKATAGNGTNINWAYDLGPSASAPVHFLDEDGSVWTFTLNASTHLSPDWVSNPGGRRQVVPRAMAK